MSANRSDADTAIPGPDGKWVYFHGRQIIRLPSSRPMHKEMTMLILRAADQVASGFAVVPTTPAGFRNRLLEESGRKRNSSEEAMNRRPGMPFLLQRTVTGEASM